MNVYIILTTILLILNIMCAISLVFVEKRDTTTTWAWLLLLFIFPFLGFILYLCLGQNISKEKIFSKKAKIDKNKLNSIIKKYNTKLHSSNKNDPTYVDLIKLNYNTNGSIYTNNNSVTTYTNGEDKFKDLFHDIENASLFINIQYYIFRCDNLGNELIKLLKRKVSEGVEVRLLVDGMGSSSLSKKDIQFIKNAGIKFSIFFPSIIHYINLRINYRNHRKIVIIDGNIGYVGGFNVGNEYVNKGKDFDFWRDTHLKIKGDAVMELQKRFTLDWEYASKESIEEKQYLTTKLTPSHSETYVLNDLYYNIDTKKISPLKKCIDNTGYKEDLKTFNDVGIQIISSGPDNLEEYIRNSYLKIINNARKNIYIQTPYLILDEPMVMSLKLAALSGVDVRIMIPDKVDHFFMAYALSASIDSLIHSGIKFYRYQKGFIHSKTIVADGIVCSIGTANLDIRSFKLNFEINAIIYDNDLASYNEEIFQKDIEDCKLVTMDEHNKRPIKTKILESLIKLVFPLL
ncbi:MAG: phosphatidylserine/phosphatidylglycerophosphate/cardiolipin synthase family protein [Clostridium sp.]